MSTGTPVRAPARVGDRQLPTGLSLQIVPQLWVLLLVLVSANWVLGPLRAYGSPATLLGLGSLLLWVVVGTWNGDNWPRESRLRGPLLAFGLWAAFTLVASFRTPTTAFSVNEGVRALLYYLTACGPALLLAEGTQTRDELERFIRVLLNAATVAAIVGIVQFRSGIDPAPWLVPPGLEFNMDGGPEIDTRSIFNRPMGTSQHPIEFGVVLAMMVPLAVRRARHLRRGSVAEAWAWLSTAIISFAALASISRSAVLALAGAAVLLYIRATPGERRVGIVMGVVFVGATRLVADGLIGTLIAFFTAGENDDSVSGRTQDFDIVLGLFEDQPFLGMGYGRFSPGEFFFLDNQLLDTLIESGFIGVTLLLLIPASALMYVVPRLDLIDETTDGLASALMAAIIGASLTHVTFDTFSFRLFHGLYFGLIGLVFATARIGLAARDQGDHLTAETGFNPP